MSAALSAMLPDGDANDADVENAEHLLRRHVGDGNGRCRACRQHYPCVPSRIAETILRTAASRF